MRLKRNKRFPAELPTSSMSDIMFFLLLFFLIIATLANPNVIKLMLPKAETNEITKRQHLSLSVTENKQYFIDKQKIPFNQIEHILKEKTTNSGDKTVILRIPYNLQVQDLVDLLQVGSKLKLNFVIATSR